jgi:hypothetical protein
VLLSAFQSKKSASKRAKPAMRAAVQGRQGFLQAKRLKGWVKLKVKSTF